jgi:hypothetical protein
MPKKTQHATEILPTVTTVTFLDEHLGHRACVDQAQGRAPILGILVRGLLAALHKVVSPPP